MVYVDTEVCEGCGLCVEACPHNALKIEDGKAVAIQGLCRDEGRCLEICPNEALMSVLEPEESRIQPVPVTPVSPANAVTPTAETAAALPARQPAPLSLSSFLNMSSVWLGTALAFFVNDLLPDITHRWMSRRRQPVMRMRSGTSHRGRKLRRRRRKGCRS